MPLLTPKQQIEVAEQYRQNAAAKAASIQQPRMDEQQKHQTRKLLQEKLGIMAAEAKESPTSDNLKMLIEAQLAMIISSVSMEMTSIIHEAGYRIIEEMKNASKERDLKSDDGD